MFQIRKMFLIFIPLILYYMHIRIYYYSFLAITVICSKAWNNDCRTWELLSSQDFAKRCSKRIKSPWKGSWNYFYMTFIAWLKVRKEKHDSHSHLYFPLNKIRNRRASHKQWEDCKGERRESTGWAWNKEICQSFD